MTDYLEERENLLIDLEQASMQFDSYRRSHDPNPDKQYHGYMNLYNVFSGIANRANKYESEQRTSPAVESLDGKAEGYVPFFDIEIQALLLCGFAFNTVGDEYRKSFLLEESFKNHMSAYEILENTLDVLNQNRGRLARLLERHYQSPVDPERLHGINQMISNLSGIVYRERNNTESKIHELMDQTSNPRDSKTWKYGPTEMNKGPIVYEYALRQQGIIEGLFGQATKLYRDLYLGEAALTAVTPDGERVITNPEEVRPHLVPNLQAHLKRAYGELDRLIDFVDGHLDRWDELKKGNGDDWPADAVMARIRNLYSALWAMGETNAYLFTDLFSPNSELGKYLARDQNYQELNYLVVQYLPKPEEKE